MLGANKSLVLSCSFSPGGGGPRPRTPLSPVVAVVVLLALARLLALLSLPSVKGKDAMRANRTTKAKASKMGPDGKTKVAGNRPIYWMVKTGNRPQTKGGNASRGTREERAKLGQETCKTTSPQSDARIEHEAEIDGQLV
jgi:hypothetical protein